MTILPPVSQDDLEHVLLHTRKHWQALVGKRIFITGGTGFFGAWLLESFAHANSALRLNAEAVVLTRDPAAFARKMPHLARREDLSFVAGDVRNFTFPAGAFSHIIHAATAASAKLNEERPEEMLDVIVGGTRRVLDFAERAGVEALLLTSSGAVYGPQSPNLRGIPETYIGAPDPLVPTSAYGLGKRFAEHLCALHAARHGYAFKLARCFAFVGPHLPLATHFAAGNFIRDALRGGPIVVKGCGSAERSYLYAADLTVWLWTILFAGASARAYNVGSDEGMSILELARLVASILPGGRLVDCLGEGIGKLPANRYVPSVDRARSELGLQIQVDPLAAFTRTIAWCQSAI